MKLLWYNLSLLPRVVLLVAYLLTLNSCIERTFFIKWNARSKPEIYLHWTGDSVDLENGPIPNYSNDWKFDIPETGSEDQQHSFSQVGAWKHEISYNQFIELLQHSPISPKVKFQRYHLGLLRFHKLIVNIPASNEIPLDNPMKNAPQEPNWENDTNFRFLSQQTKQELLKKYELSVIQFYADQYENVLKMIRDSILMNHSNRELLSQWPSIQKKRWYSTLDTMNPINNSLDYWSFLKDSVLPTSLPIELVPKVIKIAGSIEDIHHLYQDLSDEKLNFRLIKSGFLITTNADTIDQDTLKWDISSDLLTEKKPIQLSASFIIFDPFGTGVILVILILFIVYRIARKQKTNEST